MVTTSSSLKIIRPKLLSSNESVKIREMMNFLYPDNLCIIFYTTDREITFDMFEVYTTSDMTGVNYVYHWLELCNFLIAPKIYGLLGISSGDSYIGINKHDMDINIIDHLYDLFLVAKHC